MRRRFRARRRRAVAAVLLPSLAALMTTTAITQGAEGDPRKAEMRPSKRMVTYGGSARLDGKFPGSPKRKLQLQIHRRGTNGWKVVGTTRTGAKGRYSKHIRPPATARWRVQLANRTRQEEPVADAVEPAAAPVDDRTDARLIKVRSVTHADVAGRNLVVGHSTRISGRVKPTGQTRRVKIHAGGRTMSARAKRNGRFSTSWKPGGTGTYRISARAEGNQMATGSGAGAGKVQVFRPAAASWYGPGFYGNRTACGQTLTTSTLGVAHKTMPCGTRLTLRYHGREVTVPVIDRGPYAGNREFDLTSATKNRLGFGSTGTVLSSR